MCSYQLLESKEDSWGQEQDDGKWDGLVGFLTRQVRIFLKHVLFFSCSDLLFYTDEWSIQSLLLLIASRLSLHCLNCLCVFDKHYAMLPFDLDNSENTLPPQSQASPTSKIPEEKFMKSAMDQYCCAGGRPGTGHSSPYQRPSGRGRLHFNVPRCGRLLSLQDDRLIN